MGEILNLLLRRIEWDLQKQQNQVVDTIHVIAVVVEKEKKKCQKC